MRRNVRIQHVVGAVAIAALLVGAQSAAAGTGRHSVLTKPEARSAATSEQSVNVMTYDIRDLVSDGSFEGSGDIAAWSKRAPN
jgi:hypothetical protein